MVFKVACLLMFLNQAGLLRAQSPYYYRINEENGLPSSEVYQVIQDDFGYMWIGCDAGLYRYDGIKFKPYCSKKQNSKSISGLKIDKDRNLWCQNFSGQIFKVSGDSLSLIIDASKKIVSYSQYTIDTKKRLWIANEKSIDVFDFKGKLLGSAAKSINGTDSVVWVEIEVDKNGNIYAGSQNNGIAIVKEKGNAFDVEFLRTISMPNQRMAFEPYNNKLIVLTEVNAERKYFISVVDQKREIVKSTFLPFTKDGLAYKVYSDNVGRNWLCTSSGITKLNKDFGLDNGSRFLLGNDKVSGIFQDREGNLWVSSLQNGIYVIPDYDLNIYDEQSAGLPDHNMTALLRTSSNELLIGTYTGSIFKLTANNKLELFPQNVKPAYRTVKKIKEDRDGFYVAHGPFSFYEKNRETVFDAFNFRDFDWVGDTLFFVTSGMFGYLPSFHQIPNKELGKRSVAVHKRGCRAIAIDREHRVVYFASIDGLFQYVNGKIEEVLIDGRSLYANKLFFDHGKLWVGSVSNGILILENNKVIEHFTEGKLLSGSAVKAFKVHDEIVYVATDEGFNVIDRKTNTFNFFGYADGIVSKEVNAIEYCYGSVYLATNKGLLKLPSAMSKNSIRPNIEITGFEVNHSYTPLSNHYPDLKYNENNITIQFNTACFKARGNFKYKYRLLGLDSNWYYNPATNNKVLYSSLPPGSFIFEVKALNEDGFESMASKIITFYISPPFWQRWWFYAVIVLAVSGIVAMLFMIRIRFITRRAELRNKVTASQLTALKSQMNPHFLFNTLNSLQDLILKHDIKSSNYYLNKFSVLMREVLDVSGKEEIVLAREIKLLDTYLELEKLRFGDEFKFEIKTDEALDLDHLALPPMIIQPFIENALKHGLLHKKGDKRLSVEFKLEQAILLCIITDNGIGRKRSEEIKARNNRTHKSFATEATDKRMNLLNSFNDKKYRFRITDLYEDEIPIGTRVVVSIPI